MEVAVMDFLRENQLNIMLYMSGVCGVLAILSMMPKFMSRRRRSILALMEFCSMLLLNFDRLAYWLRTCGEVRDVSGEHVADLMKVRRACRWWWWWWWRHRTWLMGK